MKNIIKNNYKLFLIILSVLILFNIKFPYYIDAPGGITNVANKIKIMGSKGEGTFNLAYVKEYRATIPTLLVAMINKDWDVIKQEEILLDNEDAESYNLRDKLLIEEGVSNSIFVAYTRANKNIEVISSDLIVTYIVPSSNTNLKVGDRILEINNEKVSTKDDISNIINSSNIGDKIAIQIKNNNKEESKYAYIINDNGEKKIGILISDIRKFKTTPKVEIKIDDNESGSSGGLIMALSVYDSLVDEDITKGFKIVGTGTIDLNGNIGSIGGVGYKLKSAEKSNADIFLVPIGENYNEAIKLKKKYNYNIKIIGVRTFDEALDALRKL